MPDLRQLSQDLVNEHLSPLPSIAELKARIRRRRRRTLVRSTVGSIAILLAVVLIVVLAVPGGNQAPSRSTRLAAYITTATEVPDGVLTQVGLPSGVTPPTALTGQPPLTDKGLPAVVYVGGEFCPFCAVARWALVVALAKFGTFDNLGQVISSSSTDVFPGIQSWSFHGSSYSSPSLIFDPAEIYSDTSTPNGQGYEPLDQMSPLQRQAFDTYNEGYNGGGGIPFIDIGNQYFIFGSSVSPSVLEGLTLDQIAADLSDPTSPVAQAIDGTANYIVAALCRVTGTKAAPVCNAPFVNQAQFKSPG